MSDNVTFEVVDTVDDVGITVIDTVDNVSISVSDAPADYVEVSISELGSKGDPGTPGTDGASWQATFETVAGNIGSWDATLVRTDGVLTSVVYAMGASEIIKTLGYTGGKLTTITLSGDTPSGITLVKTFVYDGDDVTAITYGGV